jgi:hypothetical protein
LRIQQTDVCVDQALEFDVPDGQFIRPAFRATALPEQLDGLAPGEPGGGPSVAEYHGTAAPAATVSRHDES